MRSGQEYWCKAGQTPEQSEPCPCKVTDSGYVYKLHQPNCPNAPAPSPEAGQTPKRDLFNELMEGVEAMRERREAEQTPERVSETRNEAIKLSALDWRTMQGIPDTRAYSGRELDKVMEEFCDSMVFSADRCQDKNQHGERCKLFKNHKTDHDFAETEPAPATSPEVGQTPEQGGPECWCDHLGIVEDCPRHKAGPRAPAPSQEKVAELERERDRLIQEGKRVDGDADKWMSRAAQAERREAELREALQKISKVAENCGHTDAELMDFLDIVTGIASIALETN